MDEIDEVKDTETARLNYVSVFVCRGGLFALGPFLPLTGASYIYCNAEAQTTTARDGDGGVMQHLAQISTSLPHIPHFIANTGTFIYPRFF